MGLRRGGEIDENSYEDQQGVAEQLKKAERERRPRPGSADYSQWEYCGSWALETSLHTNQGEFPVVDEMGRPIGLLARNDMIRALNARGPSASVAERLLQEKSAPAVAVVDASGQLVGLVTSETIGQMLVLHQTHPPGSPGAEPPAN
jgi:CBS domain